MTTYEPGDRVSVLYLSKMNGTCLAYNRPVIDIEPHDEHGQMVWVNMPDDAALGSLLSFYADDSDGIAHMEGEPIEQQTPGRLEANLRWYLEAAAPESTRLTWPSGRGHLPVRVPFTEKARALHARMASHYIQHWQAVDPNGLTEWMVAFTASPK
ncbi:hypothetical protein [Streptomyces sp. NPDC002851]